MKKQRQHSPHQITWVADRWQRKLYISEICALRNAYDRTHVRWNGNLHKQWADYGGRGLGFEETWVGNFDAFMDCMGPKPDPSYTLERKDNNLGYFPHNCRWASRSEQQLNRRMSVRDMNATYSQRTMVTAYGETRSLAEWCKLTPGLSPSKFRVRVLHGWSVEHALTTPVTRSNSAYHIMLRNPEKYFRH